MIRRSLSLRPSAASLATLETCALRLAPDDERLAAWHSAYVSNHAVRIAHDLDLARARVPSGGTILEFGAVPLLLTAALAANDYDVTGVDIAPERYQTTIDALGLKVARCDIEHEVLPFPDASFDAVLFNELFEHLRINPIFTLSEVLRVLRPGGTLMLSTPNLRSLDGIVNFLLRNRAYSCASDTYAEYEKLETIGHMGHVREYTTREVVEFLEHVGFTVAEVIFRGRLGSRPKRIAGRAFPSLRPFVSYAAKRPGGPQTGS